jgi:hypothetical protein
VPAPYAGAPARDNPLSSSLSPVAVSSSESSWSSLVSCAPPRRQNTALPRAATSAPWTTACAPRRRGLGGGEPLLHPLLVQQHRRPRGGAPCITSPQTRSADAQAPSHGAGLRARALKARSSRMRNTRHAPRSDRGGIREREIDDPESCSPKCVGEREIGRACANSAPAPRTRELARSRRRRDRIMTFFDTS